MPAVPDKGSSFDFFIWNLYPPLTDEPGDYLQVPLLIWGGEGHPQPETSCQRELLLHGVAGVHVIVGFTFFAVGEALPDQIPAVGGGVEPDVLGRLLDGAFEECLQRLVLDLVLLEGEIVDEEYEARAAPAQGFEQTRQLPQVFLGELDEAQAAVRVLVQDGFYGRGLAGTGQTVEEGVMRGEPGEKPFRVL